MVAKLFLEGDAGEEGDVTAEIIGDIYLVYAGGLAVLNALGMSKKLVSSGA